MMSETGVQLSSAAPSWRVDTKGRHRRIVLSGNWRLFFADHARRRLFSELGTLEDPQEAIWDLNGIFELDSAGVWQIWQIWNKQLPEQLECRDPHRWRFEKMAEAHRVPPVSRLTLFLGALDTLGANLIGSARHAIGLFVLLCGVLMDIITYVSRWRLAPIREITASIYHNGASLVLLLGILGYVIGAVMSLQLQAVLSLVGANQRIIGLMGTVMIRELGPVIAGLIQVGRSGSAITAGIAGMHLTEELDALKAFGSTPRLRLVTPRVVAMVVTTPLLVVWTDSAAIFGSATAAQLTSGTSYKLFLVHMPASVSIFNFWLGLFKGVLFGLVTAVVASYFGLIARADIGSLGAQTKRSVVVGLSLILIIDALIGAILFQLGSL